MKMHFNILFLSFSLSASALQGSYTSHDHLPEMLANRKGNHGSLSVQRTNDELSLLNEGLSLILERDLEGALRVFKDSTMLYRSPLGYLYASALEQNPEEKKRYFRFCKRAIDNNELKVEDYLDHYHWIKDSKLNRK